MAMADDGITTVREMLHVLSEAMEICQHHLKNDLAPRDANGLFYETYCKGEWDQLTCWPNSAPGKRISVKCPEYIVDFDHTGHAFRQCHQDGTWATVENSNQTWTDYSNCHYPPVEEVLADIKNGDPKIKGMIQLYTVGYSFSLVALVFAIIILAYFKRLHCTRNYIHMHLFASFILRAVSIFVKDRVLYYGAGILDIQTQGGDVSVEALQLQLEDKNHHYYIGCKLVITLFHYFVATNYYWILVEALYLHSLIFVAFFSDKKYLYRFAITGWGVPVLFVVPWAMVRAILDDTGCWDIAVSEYKWIYNGPIVVANVINFLLFLNIIRVLWYKMRKRGSVGRSAHWNQYKKLAKSTLILIPMFGVHAIVFIGMPDNITSGIWWDIRMYFDLFFNSFQGFFVAIIYCFCNGEVQTEFKKAWERFNISVEMQRGRRERSRSSVTMLTSFNSSGSQQPRLSIGGQSSTRGGNSRSNGTALLSNSNHQSGDYRNSSGHKKTDSAVWNTSEPAGGCETSSFINKPSDNSYNGSSDQANMTGSVGTNGRPPFIRTQSSTLPLGINVTLPITEERDLEEAFECAVEMHIQDQMSCPAGSFSLGDNINGDVDCGSDEVEEEEASKTSEIADELDCIISCEETTALRQKRMLRGRRAESEDSGISSSTFYSSAKGRDRNASHSDYCGDSEDVISDDVRHSSDGEGAFTKLSSQLDNIETSLNAKSDSTEQTTFLSDIESTV